MIVERRKFLVVGANRGSTLHIAGIKRYGDIYYRTLCGIEIKDDWGSRKIGVPNCLHCIRLLEE